jgi:proline dehydrogenase
MLRSFFIYLSKAGWARKMVSSWSIGWRMASRFIAGETLAEAIKAVQALNAKGINATLDHLGEHTLTEEASRNATREILLALDAICETGARANVSIKLTQIGLNIDRKLCEENLIRIMEYARGCNNFIRADMEDSSATQVTLDIVFNMHKAGFTNIGTVIQSYLYRSDADVQALANHGVPVRLCKGAYKEPPEVAYPKKKDVDEAFDHLGVVLIQAALKETGCKPDPSGKYPPLPALATHDENRILYARQIASEIGLPAECLEFQLLHGIRRDLQERLSREGCPVRVYVPYGTEWYPYFMRRLAERPANVWFLLTNFFRS